MTDRDLDRQVAEKVMGWKAVAPEYPDSLYFNEIKMCVKFEPTTDPIAWMQVVEKMRELEFRCLMQHHNLSRTDIWDAEFRHATRIPSIFRATDESLGRAICLAALKATKEARGWVTWIW